MTMNPIPLLLPIAAALALLPGCQRNAEAGSTAKAVQATSADTAEGPVTGTKRDAGALIARGDYLVRTTGCNDCHTAGYADAQGQVDKVQWLTGSPLGWHGPWGTTFAANLRMKAAGMDEASWLAYTGDLHTRPPMPDFALRAMTRDDRRAIYHFIASLGPGGQPAPTYLPPGQPPQPPYFQLVLPPAPVANAVPPG